MSGLSTHWYRLQGLGITISSATVFWSNCSLAQITPDNTLPNNSNVRIEGNTSIIEAGTQAGSNLFHSFQEFSVPTDGIAYFNNTTDVQNIISRVTGGSVSNIDGLIRANGAANLFLINPEGIIFNSNARLNIGGSFLATTANSLKFADGKEFNAKFPESTPLLTLNVPIGLQFGTNTAQIQVNGSGAENLDTDKSIDSNVGLQVLPGKSLSFVGGNLSLDGGILQATGGRVELGGLAEAGTVGLSLDNNNLQLSFPSGVAQADILFTNASGINVVAENGGSIAVNARNLDVLETSSLIAGIGAELGEVGSKAGDITLNATGTVKFERSQIINSVNSNAIGDGGNITVQGKSILFDDDSTLSSVTDGRGSAGNISLVAEDFVTFQDSSTFTFVGGNGVGNGADITIQAKSFSLLNGSGFLSLATGQGDAGDVTVDVSGSVTLAGMDSNGSPSGMFTNTVFSNVGKSGDITIRASSLSLGDGAQLDVSAGGAEAAGDITIVTSDSVSLFGVDSVGAVSAISSQVFGIGSGGNINIRANSLLLQNGARLNSNTQGQGNAGNVKLEVIGAVSLTGVDKDGDAGGVISSVESNATGLGGDINIQANSLFVSDGAKLLASTFGQGDAGNITVNVMKAIAFDGINSNNSPSGAFTTVEPDAVGNAGNINLTARSIHLDNQAAISAITALGNGGNINLQVKDILLLRHNSNISTSAGTTGQGGDGGNITINAPQGFIVAVPKENSDITANAYTGEGGKVDITASGIFGIQPRKKPTPLSDITASSELGLNGIIELNILNVNPSQGLVELPVNFIDASQQIVQSCNFRRGQTNSFVVTGRGGMPLSPSETLRQRAVITQWVTLDEQIENQKDRQVKPIDLSKNPTDNQKPIVEAQGWIVDKRGNVHLVAQVPNGMLSKRGSALEQPCVGGSLLKSQRAKIGKTR